MPRPTFYLYEEGFNPSELWLGHIVYGDYKTPTQGKTSSIDNKNDSAESDLIVEDTIENCMMSTASISNVGATATVVECLTFGMSSQNTEIVGVAAKKCRRVRIRDQQIEAYLNQIALKEPKKVACLQEWTAISNSDYMKRVITKGTLRPRIWMLTGLYEMQDTKCFRTIDSSVAAKAGLGAELMASLGMPVTVETSAEQTSKVKQVGQWMGEKVWAARYQCLNLKYSALSKEQKLPALSLPIEMRQLLSTGAFMGDEDDDHDEIQDIVTLEPSHEADISATDPGQFDAAYFTEFGEAEDRYREA